VGARPYFTIVTPVYNREQQIGRAVESCLAQSFADFEAIVVDDGSTDNTAEAVLSYSDPRIRLIRSAQNRGVCPARNAAIRAAQGEWIVFLDSDDELLPECLRRMSEEVSDAPRSIGRIGFLYQFDDGRRSPFPVPPQRSLGYTDWLEFIERARLTDSLWATRRGTFEECMLPESFATEFSYNLDFSKRFQWKVVPEVLGLEHSDSPTRLTFCAAAGDRTRELEREHDRLNQWILAVSEHGAALRQFAPSRHQALLRAKAISYMLVGKRWTGFRAGMECLRHYPQSPVNWAVLAAGLAGPTFTRGARMWRSRRHAGANHDTGLLYPASFCPPQNQPQVEA
jgi:glycosyltransferase involved in cell wall biosynthesis